MNRFYIDEDSVWITDGEISMNLRLPGEAAYKFAQVIYRASPGGTHRYVFGRDSRLEFTRLTKETTLLTVHDWECFVLEWPELLQFVDVLKRYHRRYQAKAVARGR